MRKAVTAAVLGLVLVATVLTRPQVRASDGPVACTVAGPDAIRLSSERTATACSIVDTAREMLAGTRGAVLAVQTAMRESGLRASAVNGVAAGAFQQIPPGPHGAYLGYDRTDVVRAARAFFTVLSQQDPGYVGDPRSNAEIIQLVRRSAANYARWQGFAERLVSGLDGQDDDVRCTDQSVAVTARARVTENTVALPASAGVEGTVTAGSPAAARAIGAALSWLGTPYVWGGGTPTGPSGGGFDCSGLTRYAYAQAGITLPRTSRAQRASGGPVLPWADAVPGDLLFYGTSLGAIHHVAIYLGVLGGRPYQVEAPYTGARVRVSQVHTGGDFRAEVVRPAARGEQ